MDTDIDTVVFVGVPDLVALTGLTKAYLNRIAKEAGAPEAKLPEPEALVNGKPTWTLDTALEAARNAGWTVDKSVVKKLKKARAARKGFVPVGTAEGAQALGLTVPAYRARQFKGTLAPPSFQLGSIAHVWDLNALLAKARAAGDPINEDAAAHWLERNGGDHVPGVNRVVTLLRVESAVTSADVDTAKRNAQLLLENPDVLNAALADRGLRVVASSVESMEANPLP